MAEIDNNLINYPVIHRYMDITELLDILKNERIILRSPEYWEDRNDYFLIQQYSEFHSIAGVFALCFTANFDKYHFWKMYAYKPSGVCVTFETNKISDAIARDCEKDLFRFDVVSYKTIREVTKSPVDIKQYPFIKRLAFNAENEIRVFFESTNQLPYRTLKIDTKSIKEIVLSPLIRDEFLKDLKDLIKPFAPSSKIRKSSILESDIWKKQMLY